MIFNDLTREVLMEEVKKSEVNQKKLNMLPLHSDLVAR